MPALLPPCRGCLHLALQPDPVLPRIALFQRPIFYGHTICMRLGVFHHHDLTGEPTPAFASAAEIELAEQLRHQLEERYLEAFTAPPSLQKISGENL